MPLPRLSLPSATARMLGICSCALITLTTANTSMSQQVAPEARTAPSTQTAGQPGPAWVALNPQQRQALAPLALAWDKLNAGQQRKWLEVSRNYFSLTPSDQAKMHGRMAEWVALSARERSAARLNFAATAEIAKELSPEEKKAKWDAYRALSPDERKKLAEQASRPPVGAATATRPVAPQKLATLPNTGNAATAATARNPKIPANTASAAPAPVERIER